MYPHHIYTRSEWGARRAKPLDRQGRIVEAFLHHTENGDAAKITQHKQMVAAVQGIQNFHMDGRGWNDIAYHFVIFQPGGNHPNPTVFAGRYTAYTPAAQLDHNSNTLAIAVYGNGDVESMSIHTRFAIETLVRQFAPDVKRFGGHRDVTATDCPGTHFYAAVPRIAQALGVRTYR